jgi:hypothetical protein
MKDEEKQERRKMMGKGKGKAKERGGVWFSCSASLFLLNVPLSPFFLLFLGGE